VLAGSKVIQGVPTDVTRRDLLAEHSLRRRCLLGVNAF